MEPSQVPPSTAAPITSGATPPPRQAPQNSSAGINSTPGSSGGLFGFTRKVLSFVTQQSPSAVVSAAPAVTMMTPSQTVDLANVSFIGSGESGHGGGIDDVTLSADEFSRAMMRAVPETPPQRSSHDDDEDGCGDDDGGKEFGGHDRQASACDSNASMFVHGRSAGGGGLAASLQHQLNLSHSAPTNATDKDDTVSMLSATRAPFMSSSAESLSSVSNQPADGSAAYGLSSRNASLAGFSSVSASLAHEHDEAWMAMAGDKQHVASANEYEDERTVHLISGGYSPPLPDSEGEAITANDVKPVPGVKDKQGGDVLTQFDPLVPASDWMIQFNSPTAGLARPAPTFDTPVRSAMPTSAVTGFNSSNNNNNNNNTPTAKNLATSLLDSLSNDFASPASALRYSEKDLLRLQKQEQEKVSAAVTEIVSLKQRLDESAKDCVKMRTVVEDYEKAMSQMIEEARQERERSKLQLAKMSEERARGVQDNVTLEAAFRDLRTRYEELKASNETLRASETGLLATVTRLQRDVQSSEQRVEAVRVHAEKKLTEANDEITKVTQARDNELSLLRAKLQRAEAKVKTLERTVEQKQAENAELVGICDDLIGKMEATGGAKA